MLDLVQQFELIKNKDRNNYPFVPGSISNVFVYNEQSAKHECGVLPVFIAQDVIEKKVKKSIN